MLWDSIWLDARVMGFAPSKGSAAKGPLGIIEDAAIGVHRDEIVWFGPLSDLPDSPRKLAQSVFSAQGMWITPGLIDCHTHLIYAGQRSNEFAMRLEGKTYADIAREGGGIMSTVQATRSASEDTLFASASKRLDALFVEGVTTLEIKSGYGLDKENEIKMLRVAKRLADEFPVDIQTTFLGAHTVPKEFDKQADAYIDYLCNEVLPEIKRENLADAVDAFCESIAFSTEQVETLFQAATELGFSVKCHAEQLTHQGGASLAAKYHALSADHLECVTEDDVKAMAVANTVAVLLPGAYYFLSDSKKPPIDLFRQHKVPIAIATDANPGSSPTCSLLLMLNMGCHLLGLTIEEALMGVTINAAKALGIADTHGSIAVGKKADFVIWDIEEPAELAYYFGYNPCFATIKNGRRYDRQT